ncbi:hypothetical protein B0H16DRAFT_1466632 [Mycena metata]|uniref:Uncharacterized protein n=1 Tax=Mycena metata TaxID=1033252 RepID=A0AAD7I6Y4_9AGAR|nr:hypothetical protein B0H16DRAFT_1466631 [Mycena metata]KAJ7736448.1 hypothetical protein B0H16DRAFT_1466632 [Mycena metata]
MARRRRAFTAGTLRVAEHTGGPKADPGVETSMDRGLGTVGRPRSKSKTRIAHLKEITISGKVKKKRKRPRSLPVALELQKRQPDKIRGSIRNVMAKQDREAIRFGGVCFARYRPSITWLASGRFIFHLRQSNKSRGLLHSPRVPNVIYVRGVAALQGDRTAIFECTLVASIYPRQRFGRHSNGTITRTHRRSFRPGIGAAPGLDSAENNPRLSFISNLAVGCALNGRDHVQSEDVYHHYFHVSPTFFKSDSLEWNGYVAINVDHRLPI